MTAAPCVADGVRALERRRLEERAMYRWRAPSASVTPLQAAAPAFQIRLLSALCGRNAECGGGPAEVGPGPQGQEKRKEKAQSKRELSPPLFFFQHTRIVFHQLAPLAGPLRPPGHAAVMAGRRACEGCAWLGTPCPGVRTRAGDRAMGPGPREGRHRPPPGVAALGHVPHPPRTAPPSSAWALASASSSRFR